MTANEERGFVLPQPGPEHELLKPFEGTFSAEVKMWMGPGDPMISTGKIVNSFHLNGLFLRQDYQGDAVDGPFPEFAGHGYWGYNTSAKMFEGFWIDTASTIMQLETGSVDESGKVWEMLSEFQMGDGPKMKKRSVITLENNEQHRMETYLTGPDGNEFKNMEITYSRIG